MDLLLDNPLSIILSLGVIILLGIFVYGENKKMKESGLSTGDYLNDILLEGHIKWVLYLLAFVCAAEAMMASSIHPLNAQGIPQQIINVPARFITHLAVNIGGLIMNVAFAQKLVEFINGFGFLFDAKKVNDPRQYMLLSLKLLSVVWISMAALYIPYLNYLTISQGIGQLQIAKWAIVELLGPFTGKDMSLVYQAHGLAADYSPMAHMDYILFASLGAMLVHYIAAGYDGVAAVTSRLERDLNGVGGKPISSILDDVRKFTSKPDDGIRYLISKAGNSRDKADSANIVASIVANYATISPQKRSRIAMNMARLIAQWKSYEASERSGKGKVSTKRSLEGATHDFFRKSTQNGGLDRALSNRRTP